MNILLTINDITITGGAERVCVNLANAFAERGHNAEILSFYRTNNSLPYEIKTKLTFMHDFGENILKAKCCQNPIKKLYFKNLHKLFLSLKVWLRYKHADTIITNNWTYAPIFKRGGGAKYIKIQHDRFWRYNKRNNLFDTLVLLSSRELDIWQRYHHNIAVIPNFLPSIPSQSTDYKQRFVLSVGRMDNGDQKGFLRLLDIWKIVQDRIKNPLPCGGGLGVGKNPQGKTNAAKYSTHSYPPPVSPSAREGENVDSQNLTKWKLIIVGDGIMKSEIEAKIHALNLQDSIILKPFTKDIESEYLSASVYAMSSHWEGFPMVLLEACSYGLPCIAFDVATGPSDIIEHSKSGFLISDNDLGAYANHLMLLMSDESMRSRFGVEAKRIVGDRFGKEVVMGEWERILGNC